MKAPVVIVHIVLMVGAVCKNIEGPIFLEEPPHWLDFTNSSGGTIGCEATGFPQPTISWVDAVDNRVATIRGLRELLVNGSLYIPPFREDEMRSDVHSTTYRCLASNAVGTILSRECKLRPEIVADYSVSVENEYTVEGNIGVLRCRIEGGLGRARVLNWLRQDEGASGRKVLQLGGERKYVATTFLTALHIRSTSIADSKGAFYCQTIHPITGKQKMSTAGKIFLTENERSSAPRIEHCTTNVIAKVGSPADLICIAHGIPPPAYRWYKESNGVLEEVHHKSLSVSPMDSILQFSRCQKPDSGQYVCVVTNVLGEDRKKLNLIVNLPLTVAVKPQHQTIDGGKTVTLNCSVEGGSSAYNIAWLKDGHPLHDDARVKLLKGGEVLEIQNVKKEDGGMYQCLARTSDETEQATAQLTLGALPPELMATFIEQTVQSGAAVSLSCQASGSPPPRISWLLDGSPLRALDGYMPFSYLDSKGQVVSFLNISHTSVHHGGFYTCLAENNLGLVSHSASLNIYGPPTPRHPLNITAVYGGSKFLYCPMAGFPVTSTTWLHRGETLSNKHLVFPNGTLLLRDLDISTDVGEYSCKVRNQQAQTATNFVYLKIMRPPEIQEFHFPNNLQEGNRAHVSCTVISGDLPIEIIWLKDGGPMPHEPDVQEQHHQFVSALLFSNLAARHSGYYTCLARNAAAQANFTSRLIVKVAPSWVIEPVDTSVLYQHPAYLHCQGSGYPEPRVTWRKTKGSGSGLGTVVDQDGYTQIADNGTIIIQSVGINHKGHYTCEIENGIGNALRKTMFLMVNVPAYFRTHHLYLNGVAGESLNLVCEAEGDLPLFITWGSSPRAHLPVPHVRYTPTGIASDIELHLLTNSDAGKYQCETKNDFGFDTMFIHVTVSEVPESPKSPEVYDVSSRWVNFRWVPPNPSGSPITQYVVQFREHNTENVWNNMTLGGVTHSHRLGTLLPNTGYEIRVLAVNKVGMGPPSELVTFKTLHEAPSLAPKGVTVETTDSRSLLVKWEPFDDTKNDASEVVGFQVLYKEIGTGIRGTKTVRGHQKQSAIISELKYYTKYEISVRAFNHIGQGPRSRVVVATTMEGVPDSSPINIRCVPMSPTGLKIKWEPPPPKYHNGIILGYKVIYKQANRPRVNRVAKFETKVKKFSNLEAHLHKLTPHTNYSIRVLAFTASGDGIESSVTHCITEEDIPGPPEKIKALVVTSDSILISWTEPIEPNGVIIKYNIYYRGETNEAHKETVFGSKTLMYECRKLKEFQSYDFWVTASTNVGEGAKSAVVSQTAVSRAPARIASFSGQLIGGKGSSLTLHCHAVGLPDPIRSWKDGKGMVITHKNAKFRYLVDNNLMLNPLSPEIAGNYSCIAQNVFGKDQITYEITVITIPKPPEVAIVHATVNSIDVQWQVSNEDLPHITAYILYYKGQNEEWQKVDLEADVSKYRLRKLQCGSQYLVKLISLNEVGKSEPSNVIKAFTNGGLPTLPLMNDFLLVNSTSVTLFLDTWVAHSCPILYFVISYRSALNSYWTLLGDKILPSEDFLITDLSPATRYQLHVSVHTEAGSLRHEFTFATRTVNGGKAENPSNILPLESVADFSSTIMANINVIIPVVSGMVCTVILVTCVAMFIKRRFFVKLNSSSNTLMKLENQRNNTQQGHTYSPSPGRKGPSSLSAHKGSDTSGGDYEICPYATFSLSNQPGSHHMRLKTFSQYECNAAENPKEFHSSSRRCSKSGISKSPPDGLSLEISCISSQQTLPIERKKHCEEIGVFGPRRGATTAFMSDSESSGDKPMRSHPTPAHKKRKDSTVFELDSSTESAEMSPEIAWRSMVRRGVSSRTEGAAYNTSSLSGRQNNSEAECDFPQDLLYEELDSYFNHHSKKKISYKRSRRTFTCSVHKSEEM